MYVKIIKRDQRERSDTRMYRKQRLRWNESESQVYVHRTLFYLYSINKIIVRQTRLHARLLQQSNKYFRNNIV